MHPAQIKAALDVAGYKQVDLAGELGLSPNTVSAVIKGRSRSKQVEERIASITGHTLEELWPQWHGKTPLILSDEERALVLLYRELPPSARGQVLPVIREMIRDTHSSPTLARTSGSEGRLIEASGHARVAGRDYHEGDKVRNPSRKK